MKKVKLEVDTLAVDSFTTTGEPTREGTVVGHASEDTNCNTACLGTCVLRQCTPVLTGPSGCTGACTCDC